MFKIESLKLVETAEFELTHPVTGEPLEDEKGNKVILAMYGNSSRQYRAAVDKAVRKNKARGNKAPSMTEARAENIEFLAELSISLTGIEEFGPDGVKGKDSFVALYSDESLSWIRDFAGAKAGAIDGFLKQ